MNELDPAVFEVLRHRLWAINDEAAVTITRVSGSPIATEGNDFNTGVMTARGEVVICGVYVLVHAAALQCVVEHVLSEYSENPGIGPGDMFITNDTFVGAPHQADVMVVAPIFRGDRLVAWCGSVVHQADVGGPVPGSISVGARSIYEEAIPMATVKIVEGGRLRHDIEREYLIRSRVPELNRLDLLGQIAANRLQGERFAKLCDQYGDDTLVGVLDRLVTSTEARFRERLRTLPDGVWHHRGFIEHDGVEEKVYEIALVMTKRDDHLDLDFTDASPQAPALINTTHATTTNYALAAVMTLLGWELPWVPAAFRRAITVRTTPGSVVGALHPAGMSMGVTAAGQEVRTGVNVCIARLLDCSDDPIAREHIMASCVASSASQTISGIHDDGRGYTTMLMDGLPGGMGARWLADGADTGGYLTAPAGTLTDCEVNELNYPIRYLWRRERADSGGPGRRRGGIGISNAYVPHHAGSPISCTMFAHGCEPPTSSGALGGEPGTQHAFIIRRAELDGELDRRVVLPAKSNDALAAGDVYINHCAGGGGLGDPLERAVEEVERDVVDGLVSLEGAMRDYGVVGGDLAATTALRHERRRARLDGRDPAPRCEQCSSTDAISTVVPAAERWPFAAAPGPVRHGFVVRRFFCSTCATQLDVRVELATEHH